MCLINEAYRRYKKGQNYQQIVSEYWDPQPEWNVLEYLGTNMTILEECNVYNDIIATMHYDIDIEKCEKIC